MNITTVVPSLHKIKPFSARATQAHTPVVGEAHSRDKHRQPNRSDDKGGKHFKQNNFAKIVVRVFAVFFVLLFMLLGFVVGAVTLILKGPSTQMSHTMVHTFMETSALKFIPNLYFSQQEVDTIMAGDIEKIEAYVAALAQVEIELVKPSEEEIAAAEDIVIEEVEGDTYYGKMVLLKDPSKMSVAVIPTFSEDVKGKKVPVFMKEAGATVGFNGGAFVDTEGMGTGGMPLGLVISQGKVRSTTSGGYSTVIGFDQEDKLFVGEINAQEAVEMGLRDAVAFGPALVKNGEVVPQGSGGGLNPRTAIGQRQDGTVLVLAIDGRQPHSLGATFTDLALIMKEYGAINAANLDGGSSTVLYVGDEMINASASVIGERPLPTAFIYGEQVEE